MDRQQDFLRLLDACRERDPVATSELVRRYLPYVRIAVRRRLSGAMRTRFDSVDFAQDVWFSFFHTALDRKVLLSEETLISYLCEMARIKVFEEYKHQMRMKVGLNKNENLTPITELPGREQTPSTAAIVDEEWERLTAGLSKRHRAMLDKLRHGGNYREIAAEFGLSERTLQRLMSRVFGLDESPDRKSHDPDC
jgi:RNA polymerase sigma factor (sigma-70 family)